MRKIFCILVVIFALVPCASCARHLTIIHANDTHSHLDPSREGDGGVIERAAFIDSVRRADGRKNVLLLHAGDFNQGSPYYTVLGGDLEVDLVNALGYDCICLGNHEFDNGIEHLTARVARLDCKTVCANYDFSSFELGKYVHPYAVFDRGGYKIGIIGLLCDIKKVVSSQTADRIPRVEGSDADIVNRWAAFLKDEQHCDLVIALTHIGYQEDMALAPLLHGVDVIVGGHSHTHLAEPSWVENADGKKIPVVTDWCWGRTMGLLKLSD